MKEKIGISVYRMYKANGRFESPVGQNWIALNIVCKSGSGTERSTFWSVSAHQHQIEGLQKALLNALLQPCPEPQSCLAAEQGTLNCIILRIRTAPFTCGADLILKPEMGPFISGQQQDTFLEHLCQTTVEVSKCCQQGTGTMRGQRIWGASKVVNKDLCFPN